MAEAPLAVASAVILPDSEQPSPPPVTRKRRQSSFSDDRSKRPRLGHDDADEGRSDSVTPQQPATQDARQTERRKSGQVEERKRGQRLFGALLGTLSQSSSSTAQKRRTDIEKRQQAKLKLQAEEQDEKKRQKLEALLVVRRREQKNFDKHSMQIRHSNMLAQAHFLRTKSAPRLYYKPWELSPGDEEKIKAQIKETKESVEREAKQWEIDNKPSKDEPLPPKSGGDGGEEESTEAKEQDAVQTVDTVGAATATATTNGDAPSSSSPKTNEDTNMKDVVIDATESGDKDAPAAAAAAADEPPTTTTTAEAVKDHGDNGEEVVEGEEDTVIY